MWSLADQPGGLYPDEAAEGLSALALLHHPGYTPVFFESDAGREALYAYIVAFAFKIFGASTLTLRATSAVLGTLGVIAIWAMARRFGRYAALAAMAWAAGSLWLICVSRDGMRNVLTVAVGAVALWTLLSWGERPTWRRAALAGVAVGAGLWTYQPEKLLPVLAVLWLLWLRRVDRARYALMLRSAPRALIAFLVVAAPMIWTAITEWRVYFGRGASVLVVNPGVDSPESVPVHVMRTIGMFLITGDPNQRHDVDALPLLGPLLIILFLLGIRLAWVRRREGAFSALLIGLVIFMLPPLIAAEGGSPHFLRSLGLVPYVAAFVGIGCVDLTRGVARVAGRGTILTARQAALAAGAVCAVALIGVGIASTRAYLMRPVDHRYTAFTFVDADIAAAAEGAGSAVIMNSYDALDVRFLDAADPPTIISPGERLANPGVYSLIVGPSRSAIAAAAGRAAASRATVAALDPRGRPAAYEVVP